MEKVLIIDVDCPIDTELFSNFGLKIVFAQEMTKALLDFNIWKEINPWQTLLIFPGNGSNLVKKEIEKLNLGFLEIWPYKVSIPAKRFWVPGQHPVASVGSIGQGVYVGLKQVIIIDDVVSSGETCRKVYKKNHIYTPGAKWQSICWVGQRSASLKKFSSFRAVEFFGEENKKAPINSLSTLIDNQEICKSYADRNFSGREEEFKNLIKAINYQNSLK